jgi:hypothetical protein
MELSSSPPDSGPGRHFFVAITVIVAVIAITAGVVLNERHRAPDAPMVGPASTLTVDPADAAAAHWDPALPPAAAALEGTSGHVAGPAPTK